MNEIVTIYRAGVMVEKLTRAELEAREDARVRAMADTVLRYIAPMACGERERAELVRRRKEAATK